ncbi:RHS repeat-associated core domain-containing protein [Chitinophaga sp. CF118]|uniref:DUF6443 domain-containing protein n=1 Tax=Chitinophaga sp. CF118 TaxID=1884367 RepID=UPI0008DEAEAA|nr:DUF6443 domain-containing protein [Chitinophaga sp. CF118]SFD98678.1 RHS repeat-associated core domain-containing protein [Chitinophaga sp. CF118]
MYNYIIATLLLIGITITSQAQNAPGGTLRSTAIPVPPPSAYTNTPINYVRTWEPSMPTTDTTAVTSTSRTVAEVKQTTQYFDGLGRSLQTVVKGISPTGKDLVTPFVYDAFGREQYKYLPYVPKTGNINDGNLKIDPFNGQLAFYKDSTLIPGIGSDSVYYEQTDYEASPLNRVLKSYAPGNSWAKTGGNHPTQQQYRVNKIEDSVRIWYMNSGSVIPVSGSGQVYAPGELYKNVMIDEAGSQIIEYKDKENHVILKKVQLATTIGTAHMGWLCTYYIYDDLGQLRFIIPPKAVDAIKGSWTISTAIAGELCFIYRHDERNRVVVKKEPGADSTEFVFDVRDRVAISRNGYLKAKGQWLFSFYDELNRLTMTALSNVAASRIDLQSTMNTATSNTLSIPYTFPGTGDLIVTVHTGNTLYQATNSITFQGNFNSGTDASFIAEINPNINNGSDTTIATNPYPNTVPSGLIPVSYTFYDDYSYTGKYDYASSDANKPQALSNPYAETNPVTPSAMTKGFVTGTKVRVLDSDQWLTTTNYYNNKGREIQKIIENASGGENIITNLYDFNGNLLSSYQRLRNLRSIITPQTTVLTMLHYDAGGRLDSVKKRIDDNINLQKNIAINTYDELGQLKVKRLNATGSATQLESLNYEYNIRGWLKSINKTFVNTSGSTANWFGQELNYDWGFDSSEYNGNISGIKWKSASDGIARAYGYDYDKTNRLTAAYFTQQNVGASAWTKDKVDFSVSNLLYDLNGNIQSMKQVGLNGVVPQTIDSLKYGYATTSNKLIFVTDKVNNAQSELGDFKEINNDETQDYWYDVNGNLTKDKNKNIDAIIYNHLSLPQSITVNGKGVINYQYDATGIKLRKTVTDNTVTPAKITTTDYISGFVYEQDTLQFLLYEEGRIRPIYKTGQPVNFAFDYFIKDHLGNTRMVLATKSDTALYAATMETGASIVENALFSNIDNTRTAISTIAGYPADNTTNPNTFVAKLNAVNGQKIGPGLVLRVMAGDTIQINTTAVYRSTAANTSSTTSPNMVTAILNAFSGAAIADGIHDAGGPGSVLNSGLTSGIYDGLKQKDPYQNLADKPKAYLNFVLFDDQFALVDDNSGVRQVQGNANVLQPLAVGKMVIKKTGFLYIYTNNESGDDVLFDNLVVIHNSGPVLEETHYYPFGLTMVGISSNALKGLNFPENRFKYNGKELQSKEFADGSGLEWYDYGARMEDPQTGRWYVPDPMSSKNYSYSPYNYALNNPISLLDPDGMDVQVFEGGVTFTGADAVEAYNQLQNVGNGSNNNDKGKDKGKGKPKTAFAPALFPLIGEGAALFGAGASTGLFHFPGTGDWKAAWNDFYSKVEYIPNGGRVGLLIEEIREYLSGTNSVSAVKVDPVIAKKMYDELTNLLSKTLTQRGAVYALKARYDGDYNVYISGLPFPVGKVPLKAGDIWKYGETTDPANRYDEAVLRREGVYMQILGTGTQLQIKAMEKFLLYGYYYQHGILPPANKMFR